MWHHFWNPLLIRLIEQFKLNFSFIYQNQAIYINHQKAVRFRRTAELGHKPFSCFESRTNPALAVCLVTLSRSGSFIHKVVQIKVSFQQIKWTIQQNKKEYFIVSELLTSLECMNEYNELRTNEPKYECTKYENEPNNQKMYERT